MHGSRKSCIKSRLIKAILSNKDKIMKDLEALKTAPKSNIEPLVSDDSLQISNPKIVKGNKRRSNEDLINGISKKIKLTKEAEYQNANCDDNKEKLLQPRKYIKRKKTGKNRCILNCMNLRKNKKTFDLNVTNRIPVVVIEKDKRLQDMVKCFITQENEKDKEDDCKSEYFNKDNIEHETKEKEFDNLEEKNDSLNEEANQGNSSLEMEKNNYNVIDNDDEYKNRNVHESEIEKLNSTTEGYIFIKEEVNDLDDISTFNIANSSLENIELNIENDETIDEMYVQAPETEINCEFSQVITNCSDASPLITDESMSSVKMSCYNNVIPTMQMFNNISSFQNLSPIAPPFIVNGAAFMLMPIPQYNPNIVVMNAGGFTGFQGMFGQMQFNPFIMNSLFPPSNFTFLQQPFNEQFFNPTHEMAKLQTAVFNLNSQLPCSNNIETQSDSTQLN